MYNPLIKIILLGTIILSSQSMVFAQSSIDENISVTGDSLQDLDSKSVADNFSQDKTPKLDVTIERENQPSNNFSTGNEFIDSLMNKPATPKTVAPIELNTNKGDVPGGGGTIPFVNF